jgi:hypothetical protein
LFTKLSNRLIGLNEREMKNKQKGVLGETVISSLKRVKEDATPVLFRAIAEDLERNYSNELLECHLFSMKIVSDPSQTKYDISMGVDRPDFDDSKVWIADISIVVSFTPEPDNGKSFIEYPVEVKTGKNSRMERGQRDCFIHLHEAGDQLPLLIQLDIEKLPDAYEIAVKKYDSEREQIRTIKEGESGKPSDMFYDKWVR